MKIHFSLEKISCTFNMLFCREDCEYKKINYDSEARKRVLKKHGITAQSVRELKKLICPFLCYNSKRNEKLIYAQPDYYIGFDTYNFCYFLCYDNVLMVDLDNNKLGDVEFYEQKLKSRILELCAEDHNMLFKIYKTINGYHIFAVHKKYDRNSEEFVDLMLKLKCDIYYIVFSQLRGCSVRLNMKQKDTFPIYTFKEYIGQGLPDKHVLFLVDLHIELLPFFAMKTNYRVKKEGKAT